MAAYFAYILSQVWLTCHLSSVFFRLFFIADWFDIYILAASQRMWALQKLRKLMVSRLGKLLNIPSLLKMEQGLNTDSALPTLLKGLPQALLRQYEYEDPAVRSGKHLMHSSFFKVNINIGEIEGSQSSG